MEDFPMKIMSDDGLEKTNMKKNTVKKTNPLHRSYNIYT